MEVAMEHLNDGLDYEDSVTCLDILKRGSDDEYAVSQLLIGTECRYFYILNSVGTSLQKVVLYLTN